MTYLIFSDIHGNLPAFESVLSNEPNVEGYINLGDVVNYGPWSNECVQIIDSLDNCYNIIGNHETYFTSGICDVKNQLVQSFFNQTIKSFKENDRIKNYKTSINIEGFELVHTLNHKEYIFRDSQVEVHKNTMLGHSHQQYLRYFGNKLLLNPGSIGQNRRFINLSNYALWNIDTGEIQLKMKKYNIDHLLNKMREDDYPQDCLAYYNNKKRF